MRFSPIVHNTTLSVFIENAYIWKRCPEWIHLKTERFENGAKRNRVSMDGENGGFRKRWRHSSICRMRRNYCSVFERCVFKRKHVSMDGENAAKTIVWTDAFFVKTECFENGASKRKRIRLVWTGPKIGGYWDRLQTTNMDEKFRLNFLRYAMRDLAPLNILKECQSSIQRNSII